jgi:outer membrane protein assembly factor BamB
MKKRSPSHFKKGLIIISFVAGIVYAGLLSVPDFMFIPLGEPIQDIKNPIVSIDITYQEEIPLAGPATRHCKIELINGEYYSNIQRIDQKLIYGLEESFTDFYEYTGYTPDPSFQVVITFKNGVSMVLRSGSDKACFSPWIIEFNGNRYLQYSGEIPTAILRILVELDEEKQDIYDKEVRWGCHPVEPQKHVVKRISDDFPRSKPASPLEVEQKKYMWKLDLGESLLDQPVYYDGTVLVLTKGSLSSVEARTGQLLWKVNHKEYPEGGILLIHEGALYTALEYTSTIWVSKVDIHSGNEIWEYEYQSVGVLPDTFTHFVLTGYSQNLLILHNDLMCLDTRTGTENWKIRYAYYGELLGNTFFFHAVNPEESWNGLVDIDTGDILWEMDSNHNAYRGYHDGLLYFNNEKQERFFSLSVNSLEEVWSYSYKDEIPPGHYARIHSEICENGIFLIIRGWKKTTIEYAKIVFLDVSGSKVWEYTYPEERLSIMGLAVHSVIESQDILYVFGVGGFIEAFSTNGEKLWETEIRGYIRSSHVLGNTLYVAADNCKVYSLDAETGAILWEVTLCDLCITNRYYHCWCSCDFPLLSEIADGMFFVGSGNILVAVSI